MKVQVQGRYTFNGLKTHVRAAKLTTAAATSCPGDGPSLRTNPTARKNLDSIQNSQQQVRLSRKQTPQNTRQQQRTNERTNKLRMLGKGNQALRVETNPRPVLAPI